MTIDELYEDPKFTDKLLILSKKNLLPFDDFRQEVFLELTETLNPEIDKVAQKVAKRMKRIQRREACISLDAYGEETGDGDYNSVLWEDRHVLV